jgi:hypothetical protein
VAIWQYPNIRTCRIQRAFESQLGIPLRNDEKHLCAGSERPSCVPVRRSCFRENRNWVAARTALTLCGSGPSSAMNS